MISICVVGVPAFSLQNPQVQPLRIIIYMMSALKSPSLGEKKEKKAINSFFPGFIISSLAVLQARLVDRAPHLSDLTRFH